MAPSGGFTVIAHGAAPSSVFHVTASPPPADPQSIGDVCTRRCQVDSPFAYRDPSARQRIGKTFLEVLRIRRMANRPRTSLAAIGKDLPKCCLPQLDRLHVKL